MNGDIDFMQLYEQHYAKNLVANADKLGATLEANKAAILALDAKGILCSSLPLVISVLGMVLNSLETFVGKGIFYYLISIGAPVLMYTLNKINEKICTPQP